MQIDQSGRSIEIEQIRICGTKQEKIKTQKKHFKSLASTYVYPLSLKSKYAMVIGLKNIFNMGYKCFGSIDSNVNK